MLSLLDPLLTLLPHLAFVFVSAVDQAINLLDKVAETVLLLTQRLMDSIEAIHEAVEIFILLLACVFLIIGVKLDNFVLPLLHIFKLLLLLRSCNQVREFWLFFALSNLHNDSHYHILD